MVARSNQVKSKSEAEHSIEPPVGSQPMAQVSLEHRPDFILDEMGGGGTVLSRDIGAGQGLSKTLQAIIIGDFYKDGVRSFPVEGMVSKGEKKRDIDRIDDYFNGLPQ